MQITSGTLPIALAEGAEAEFMYQYGAGTPALARMELGIGAARLGGGILLSMGHDTTGYWNKALGFSDPITGALVDRVLDHYRAKASPRAVLQIAPSALPADWEAIRSARGLEPGRGIVKLACPIDDARPGGTRLRVGPVTENDAEEWANVILRTFGMPTGPLTALFTASVGHPRFRAFAVWDGTDIVAGASLYLYAGMIGALNAGATLPSHRSLGAQSALITARAEAAREAGCRWLIAETGHPEPGEHNPSLANMRRAGFVPQYVRQNWIYQP